MMHSKFSECFFGMRLNYIKISGFKTFVEPTKIEFNQPISAIVGPNGCGKSNIIDAIKWVLGESATKHLRGDMLTDVIFSGSKTRRPSGRASVELFFEQNATVKHHAYQNYNEISVKRVMHRDGKSQYFFNGQSCRRRDITDVFLGTGLSPRSYAIIEQGMISRLIEAKPLELRYLIEEAAGVSQYRERRKEAEHKIKAAQDNLVRVTDLNSELHQQVQDLAQQAQATENFYRLKQQYYDLEDQEQYLHYQAVTKSQKQQEQERILLSKQYKTEQQALVKHEETIQYHHQHIAELRTQESTQVQLAMQTHQDLLQLEQSVKEQQQAYQQVKQQQQTNTQQQKRYIQEKEEYVDELERHKKLLHETQQQLQKEQKNKDQAVSLMQQNDAELQVLARRSQQAHSKERAAQQDLGCVQKDMLSAQLQCTQLDQNLQQLKLSKQQVEVSLQPKVDACARKLQQENQVRLQQQVLLEQKQLQQNTMQLKDEQLSKKVHHILGTQAEQKGLLKSVQHSIAQQQLDGSDAVFQYIEYPEQWTVAIQQVLAPILQQPVVASMHDTGFICHAETQTWGVVTSSLNLEPWLAHVRFVEQPPEHYDVGLMYVYPDGRIEGYGYTLAPLSSKEGILVALQEENKLQQHIHLLDVEQAELQQQATAIQKELKTLTNAIELHRGAMVQQQNLCHTLNLEYQQLQQHEQDRCAKWQKLDGEEDALGLQLDKTQCIYNKAWQQCQAAEADIERMRLETEKVDKAQEVLNHKRHQLHQRHQKALSVWQHQQEKTTQLEAKCHWQAQKIIQVEASLLHTQQKMQTYIKQVSHLEEVLPQKEQQLQQQLRSKKSEEDILKKVKQKLQADLNRTHNLQKNTHRLHQSLDRMKSRINQFEIQKAQLEHQKQTCITRMHRSLHEVQESVHLMQSVSLQMLQQKKTEQQEVIDALGYVNLAALEQYKQAQERYQQASSQAEDLQETLDGLYQAIEMIDKVSKKKFKETFIQVNEIFGQLFADVFKGGKAALVRTEQEWLHTGVVIKAQPPGKKNSTIGLLSGGEKALTALSLVFSLFTLNPAPFCLLDEVDAPLDDVNVQRFCTLINKLADKVQFMMISHNKLTMAQAQDLIGVTMQEAGVSRIVTVNMKQALESIEAV